MEHIVYAGYQFADDKPDYLVNDAPDPENLPDTLYLSNGSTNAVNKAPQAHTAGTARSESRYEPPPPAR